MRGRRPLAALDIRVHPATIDVNVHPTKSEVKFRDSSRVFGVLGRAVRDALVEGGARPWADAAEPAPFEVAQRRFELRRLGDRWDHDQRSGQEREVGDAESVAGGPPSVDNGAWNDPAPFTTGQRAHGHGHIPNIAPGFHDA